MNRDKFLVTLHLQFEIECDTGDEKSSVQQLLQELKKVPLIAVGTDIHVNSVVPLSKLN